MKANKLADLLPKLSAAELNEMAEDIAANGQREEIVILNGEILDGRNRFEGCAIAKVSPRLRQFGSDPGDGLDPLKFIISKNLKRRNLSDSQRAIIAAELADAEVGKPAKAAEKNGDEPSEPKITQATAAKLLNVKPSAVRHAAVVKKASPKVKAAVKAGKMSIAKAAATVKPSKPKPIHKKAPAMKPADKMLMALDVWWLAEKKDLMSPPMANPESMMKHFSKLIIKTLAKK